MVETSNIRQARLFRAWGRIQVAVQEVVGIREVRGARKLFRGNLCWRTHTLLTICDAAGSHHHVDVLSV